MDYKPKVIYDIGACVGHWTRHARRVFPDSRIFLFDASKSVEPEMHKMVDSGMAQGCITAVLSNQKTTVDFYDDPMNLGGNSYYKETTGHYDHILPEERETFLLDHIVESNNWPKPDMIKLDVQGAELDVLEGAHRCLETVQHIILESQTTEYNEGAPLYPEVEAYLTAHGFELVGIVSSNTSDKDYHFKRV